MRRNPKTGPWRLSCAALLTLSLTACASEPVTITKVRVETVPVPAPLLTCRDAPEPPAAGTQRAVAAYLLDLWDAGEDCRAKLRAVRDFVASHDKPTP